MKHPTFEKECKRLADARVAARRARTVYNAAIRKEDRADQALDFTMGRYLMRLNRPGEKRTKKGAVYQRFYWTDKNTVSSNWYIRHDPSYRTFRSESAARKAAKLLLNPPKACDAFKKELATLMKKYEK